MLHCNRCREWLQLELSLMASSGDFDPPMYYKSNIFARPDDLVPKGQWARNGWVGAEGLLGTNIARGRR